jgi:hypothetical protein
MGKNKGKKANQPNTSPENYIKTRARNLPIGKCYINEGWESLGFATIVVSRNHTNGNSTFALFLVDTYCLGVKETLFSFNQYAELEELMDKLEVEEKMIEIEYPLAHNIIYGGIEYAASFGFKPHKEFEITQYLLEEDDDRAEFMEIEFGLNGKPAIFVGKERPPSNIIAALEQSVGKGNYTIITEEGLADEEDFDEEDFDEEDEEELTGEDIVAIFEGKKKPTPAQMVQLLFPVYEKICTQKEVEEMDEILNEVETWEIVEEYKTDDPLFLNDESESQYNLLYEKVEEDPENSIPEIEELIAENPNEYYLYSLLVLAYGILEDKEKQSQAVVSKYTKFPQRITAFTDYIIIQNGQNNCEDLKKLIGNEFDIHKIFPHRHQISFNELISLAGSLFVYFSGCLGEPHKGVAYVVALSAFIFYGSNKEKANQIQLFASRFMFNELENRDQVAE